MAGEKGKVRVGRVVALIVAVLAGTSAFVLIGALVARLVGDGAASWGTAYAVAALTCLVAPIYLGVKVAGSEAKGPIVTGAIATVNVVVLLLVLGLAPTPARAALHSHGTWFLFGIDAPSLAQSIAGLGDRIPRSEPPEPLPDADPVEVAEPPPSPVDAGLDAGPAPEPVVPDQPWSAAELFAHRADSVVTIQVRAPIDPDDPLADLLEEVGMDMREGSGSGFVVSSEGLIVTNHHVIGGAASARVVLRDGRTFDTVSLLASDPANDLGVIQIDAQNLPVAPLAPNGEPTVGATVFALGSPLGLDHTLTQGIASAIREESGTTFVQMQAPIAPGSSGGPLFDTFGRVVGVNTATRSAGLNFAVRVDHVRALLEGPRLARPLASYGGAAHATSMESEGAPLLPTIRMMLEPLGVATARLAARCIEEWPPEPPVISVTIERSEFAAEVTSDRGDAVDLCLADHRTRLVGMQAAMIAREVGDAFTAVVRVEGIGATGDTPGRTVVVRFVQEARAGRRGGRSEP